MNKVLMILDGTHVPAYLLDTVTNISYIANYHLHALFLNKEPTGLQYDYFFPNDYSLVENPLTGKSIEQENKEIIAANIQTFKDTCGLAGLSYSIDERGDYSLGELLQLTAFCDLVLADAKSNFYEFLLSDLLTDAHCPFLLTKQTLAAPDKIVLAYDGSLSSIYAIKMFTYLFPQWKDVPLQVVYISEGGNRSLPREAQIRSWLTLHYTTIAEHVLTGSRLQALADFINTDSNRKMVIMGAYGKKGVSRLFHKSITEAVTDSSNAAIFIAHV
jgi:hypothetical protein